MGVVRFPSCSGPVSARQCSVHLHKTRRAHCPLQHCGGSVIASMPGSSHEFRSKTSQYYYSHYRSLAAIAARRASCISAGP